MILIRSPVILGVGETTVTPPRPPNAVPHGARQVTSSVTFSGLWFWCTWWGAVTVGDPRGVSEPDHDSWNPLTIVGTGRGLPGHRPVCRATLGVTWPSDLSPRAGAGFVGAVPVVDACYWWPGARWQAAARVVPVSGPVSLRNSCSRAWYRWSAPGTPAKCGAWWSSAHS